MELIELDATAQRALELLTNAGMSDGSIYDYISWWLYEGEPDYKVWSSDNTEEWNLTEPEALYDFIVNECQE